MSNDSKPLIWIIVIVVVLALAGVLYSQYGNNAADNENYEENGSGLETQTDTTISSTSTSNADLNQDMTKVDAQLQGLDNDSVSANQSSY